MRLLTLLVVLGVAGCAPAPALRSQAGGAVAAPYGFVAYCRMYPDRPECAR